MFDLFSEKMKITVIGESNIDVAVRPYGAFNATGCTPGNIAFHHGGVARNIAHNLCLLGHEVRLMSVFGSDDFAEQLLSDCKQIGMDLSLSTQFKEAKSPIFLSFNNDMGDMQSAVSDVGLNERMDIDWLREKTDAINQSELVVADTLLSVEALTHLIDYCKVPLYIDTVSPGKALRFAEAMQKSKRQSVFALKCNLSEAQAITGKIDAFEAAKALNANGVKHVYLTMGSKGVVYCHNNEIDAFSSLPTKIVNVTGSGDAFFAGVIHANASGLFGKEAVTYGLKAAQHNIKNEAPVNPTLRISVFDE